MTTNRPYRLRMRRGVRDWEYACRTFSRLDKALAAAYRAAQYDSALTAYRVEFEEIDRILVLGDISRDEEERAVLTSVFDNSTDPSISTC